MIDHYQVLGLSSSESIDCTKLTESEIKAAYRKKALELHPDKISRKRKRDPSDDTDDVNSMTASFQQLQSSYEVLTDKVARKNFDTIWLQQRQTQFTTAKENDSMENDSMAYLRELEKKMRTKREQSTKLARELEEMKARKEMERRNREREEEERREREAIKKIQEEERMVHDKLFEKISNKENIRVLEHVWMMKCKTLKVSWNKVEYGKFSEVQIRDMFDYFGEVKDVRIDGDSEKGEALVVMGSRDSVAAASVATWVNHPASPFAVRPLTLC